MSNGKLNEKQMRRSGKVVKIRRVLAFFMVLLLLPCMSACAAEPVTAQGQADKAVLVAENAQLFMEAESARQETDFVDVSADAWYAPAVAYVKEHGLFNGTSSTTFSPEETMTQGMFVQVLANRTEAYRASDWADATVLPAAERGKWYAPAASWAVQNGIADGLGSEGFAPEEAVTREQMAVFLYNYAKAIGCEIER